MMKYEMIRQDQSLTEDDGVVYFLFSMHISHRDFPVTIFVLFATEIGNFLVALGTRTQLLGNFSNIFLTAFLGRHPVDVCTDLEQQMTNIMNN